MVATQAARSTEPPPYPETPVESMSARVPLNSHPVQPASESHQHDIQDGFVNLTLKDGNEVDDNSDWDASDREDNDTNKMLGERPAAGRATPHAASSRPHLAEHQIPEPLRLKKPSTQNLQYQTTDQSQSHIPAVPSPAPPVSRPSTNPFRRPSEMKRSRSVSENGSATYPITGADNGQSASAASPWQDEHIRQPCPSAAPSQPAEPLLNPWAEQEKQVDGHAPSHQDNIGAGDSAYIADLIDLGPEQSSGATPSAQDSSAPTNGTMTVPQSASQTAPGSGITAASTTTSAEGQRNKFYQIKHIRWHDPTSARNPRHSPILTQNANGPCPLLALVNALSLSTPPDMQTALIETLRTRETVSLGLLLDAVFDELMSGRRGGMAQALPDVGELYAFLVTLHTGMNVNPRFVPDEHNHLFEQTKEMLLYSTFAVPLVHGWLPNPSEPAYSAFHSTAPSYEDAQNAHFRQEELEQKLGTAELDTEEQAIRRDLPMLKQFLSRWPTQLTEYGLGTLQHGIQSGQVAILFRNDHFSTVYRNPNTNQLMTLVTDAGYSTHDEIVWESLVDINGAESELFSGDFRSVSHEGPGASAIDGEWTTVQSKKSKNPDSATTQTQARTQQTATPSQPQSHAHAEQQDADLALALQLQEEEEHRERESQAARRREERLSENYLDNESARRGPQIPPRGRRNQSQTQTPTQTHRPSQTQSGDELPSYEQAASDRRYHPPSGQPPGSAPCYNSSQRPGMGRIPGAQGPGMGRRGRRPGATPFDATGTTTSSEAIADRREGCTIM